MGSANATLVRYSEFHASGYAAVFSWIWFTKGKLQYNGFLQYNWRQFFVLYLESVYLFWYLHFDICSIFLVRKIISSVGSNFQFFV